MAAMMELHEMLTNKVMEIKVWSVNAIRKVERKEKIDDEVYFYNDEKEGVVENHGMGSHSNHQEASQSSWREGYRNQVSADVKVPLVEMVTTNLECVGCCGDNITKSGKTLHNSVESVDEDIMEQDYKAMLFQEPLKVVLLNRDRKGIEGFEEICHALTGLGSYSY
ncbi:hypothetical protein HAX54_045720 [Datura stramonium]|uniref:Uncharacterized protein n=1 Tax=Datura stramonium TaxID=4076 RepID=A0ABS8WIB6_DATST|nr:hypothetical protein [Datura stramonium]